MSTKDPLIERRKTLYTVDSILNHTFFSVEIGRFITKISPSKNRTCDFHRIRLKRLINCIYVSIKKTNIIYLLISDHLINFNLSELVSRLLFNNLPAFMVFLMLIMWSNPCSVLWTLEDLSSISSFQSK